MPSVFVPDIGLRHNVDFRQPVHSHSETEPGGQLQIWNDETIEITSGLFKVLPEN